MSAETALSEDSLFESSHKSYAQALKESAKLRPRQDWSKLLNGKPIAITAPEGGQVEDWIDVASTTSCGWPETESVVTESQEEEFEGGREAREEKETKACVEITTVRKPAQKISHIAENLPKSVKDVPWVDQDSDTRLPHALHEEITHTNRSRRMYNTMHPEYSLGVLPLFGDDSALEIKKPWRKWPGKRLFKGDRYTSEQQETRDKRIQRAEWKRVGGDLV